MRGILRKEAIIERGLDDEGEWPCDICGGRRGKVSKSKWLEFKRTWIKGEVMDESVYTLNEAKFLMACSAVLR